MHQKGQRSRGPGYVPVSTVWGTVRARERSGAGVKNAPPALHGAPKPAKDRLVGKWSPWWIVHYYIPLMLIIVGKTVVDRVAKKWGGYLVEPGDPTYNKPDIPAFIPSWANAVLSISGPALLVLLGHLSWVLAYRRSTTLSFAVLDIHNAWLGLVASWMLSGMVTSGLKHALGLPRSTFGASGERGSFPSAHTTLSAMGFVFLFWYVAGKWNVYANAPDDRRPTSWWKVIVLGLLLAVPITVGATRVRDFSHFPIDVVTGFWIGATTSTMIYRTLYRWPWESRGWEPLYY